MRARYPHETLKRPSAWFYHVSEDLYGYLLEPAYNSYGGFGEYLIDIYATLWGHTATGETTFSEIKLIYGDRQEY